WAALLPTLLRQRGELDMASTPRGCGNLFHTLRGNDWFQTRTLTLPGAIAQGLETSEQAMRASIGDERLFRQEFLCEFDAGGDALLPYELIAACTEPGLSKHADSAWRTDKNSQMYAGVDIGRMHDLTVIWVWQRDADHFRTRGVWEL